MNMLAKIARVAAGCALAWLCAVPGAAQAQAPAATPDLVAALREQIMMVPVPGKLFGPELETTVFRPPGEARFPSPSSATARQRAIRAFRRATAP